MLDPRARLGRTCLVTLLLAAAAPACIGSIGEGDDVAGGAVDPQSPPAVDPALAGAASFRRLTRAQYVRTLATLLGSDTSVSPDVAEVEVQVDNDGEYASMAAAREGWSRDDVDALYRTAEAATELVFSDPARRLELAGCDAELDAQGCAATFAETFGRRAFRRPLNEEEKARYTALAVSVGEGLGDPWAGVAHAAAALVQSPMVIYLPEVGEPDPAVPGRRRYTSLEMASRLAFALTGAPPDAELLDAGESGALVDVVALRGQAERLLQGQGGRDGIIGGFFTEYFALDVLAGLGKDAETFPAWTPTLAAAMREELVLLLERTVFEDDAAFVTLLENRATFVNAELAELYGVDPPAGDGFQPVVIPDDWARVGILGSGAFLAMRSALHRTSPTRRGKFVSERLLCRPIAAPPADVPQLPNDDPSADTVQTMRDKLSEHRENPACAGCHDMMDPLGLTLEHFDGIGRHRETDDGLELDVTGALDGQTFDGAAGMARALAEHPDIEACLARQAFRWLSGTREGQGRVEALADIGEATDGKVGGLVLRLVESDLFRFFAPEAP